LGIRASGVAFDGETIVAGAGGFGRGHMGQAYVFRHVDNAWLEEAHLLPEEPVPAFQDAGVSVAIDDHHVMLAVGGHPEAGHAGRVFEFTRTGDSWVEGRTFVGSNVLPEDNFGSGVTLRDNLMIAGTPRVTAGMSGLAYLFDVSGGRSNHLAIWPDPLRSGERATFSVTAALPNEPTWLLYSFTGLGQTYIPALNVIVDLANPKLGAGPRRTDANGDWQWSARMPGVHRHFEVWFQAVQKQNVTNYMSTSIIRQ